MIINAVLSGRNSEFYDTTCPILSIVKYIKPRKMFFLVNTIKYQLI